MDVSDSFGLGNAMRGADQRSEGIFSYVRLEQRVPADYPLRAIRDLCGSLSKPFDLCDIVHQCRLASIKSRIESGTSPKSTYRRCSSSAISMVTSRHQPSAVLKATMRAG